MKRIMCICIVLIMCFNFLGCQKDNTLASLPPLALNEKESLHTERLQIVSGIISAKPYINVLVLTFTQSTLADEWGESIYVITNQVDEFCIGDDVHITFNEYERPNDKSKFVRIFARSIYPRNTAEVYKPIIYLYPEAPTVCSVKLKLNGTFTCTYPEYKENGWDGFTAYPDGTLVFPDGEEYYALYWEGLQNADWDLTKGFCVRGEDTAEFLEWALSEQGLSRREANEFIVYWLPLMEENPYNVISFQTKAYTDTAVLEVSPKPDSVIRVFMTFYASETEVSIPAQTFTTPARNGFTVVEWGGSEIMTN